MSDASPSPLWVLPPPPRASVAVDGESARFPVRRISCIGRNYARHALEMGGDPDREPPFYFSKPADAVLDAGPRLDATVAYPARTTSLHHEVELAVAIGVGGVDIPVGSALGHVFGYAVSVDLTRRDLQQAAKEQRRPWAESKGFDQSAPLAPLHRARDVGHPAGGRIWLSVDGQVRQDGDLGEMIWGVAEIIATLSRSFALQPGDLILTGTPAGVGPIERGQAVRAGIEGLGDLAFRVVS